MIKVLAWMICSRFARCGIRKWNNDCIARQDYEASFQEIDYIEGRHRWQLNSCPPKRNQMLKSSVPPASSSGSHSVEGWRRLSRIAE
jgi:hypothetical protein